MPSDGASGISPPPGPEEFLTAPLATEAVKKKNKRRRKKKPARRESFAASGEGIAANESSRASHDVLPSPSAAKPQLYKLGQSGRNLSDTSLDSQALLDHRDHPPMRARRESRAIQSGRGGHQDSSASYRQSYQFPFSAHEQQPRRPRPNRPHTSSEEGSAEEDFIADARTPLLSSLAPYNERHVSQIGALHSTYGLRPEHRRCASSGTSGSSRRRNFTTTRDHSTGAHQGYDVNNPPSVPNSPILASEAGFDSILAPESFTHRGLEERRATAPACGDQIIDIDGSGSDGFGRPVTLRRSSTEGRRRSIVGGPEEDVCFPVEGMSEIAEEDYVSSQHDHDLIGPRRRSRRQWPDFSALDDWSREEKEVRSEGIRAKKISEPVLVGGRLRPQKNIWHRTEEDAPYRFTYFNEEFQSTIHSQTISELVQPGQSFRDLFIPDPPELSDTSSDDEDTMSHTGTANGRTQPSPGRQSRTETRGASLHDEAKKDFKESSGEATPIQPANEATERPKRYGARPTFWLDVLSPTDTEMRVLSKTFGIHPLTAEDIMMQEAREKVELFRNYYFVNYRTFEQDMSSEDYLQPVNMYVVVFREGVISFHFSMTPHPANVRRRIRQLKDYLILSSDWISYAIIDDITDVFAPLIQSIEEEVDEIDDAILELHMVEDSSAKQNASKKASNADSSDGGDHPQELGGDMLRRVGQGRKKVMGLYRLLGNKADVIKGFAKRCNEHWEIAPRSEIGLYLGDIQDHILTMTSNLGHYETLLSRAHSNYLAQINIRMNERQEQTADVLGKLTVLGTIVLPMNIITGMWGMNVNVPGQFENNLYWFWSILGGLLIFGISCFFIAKRVYGIV